MRSGDLNFVVSGPNFNHLFLVDYVSDAQIQRDTGLWYAAEYSTFSISDETDEYRLTVDGYSGDYNNNNYNYYYCYCYYYYYWGTAETPAMRLEIQSGTATA